MYRCSPIMAWSMIGEIFELALEISTLRPVGNEIFVNLVCQRCDFLEL
jgi:hypothetical protein